MSEIAVLEDTITDQWIRKVHLMSNAEFSGGVFEAFGIPEKCGDLAIEKRIGVWHLRATWRIRQAVRLAWQGNLPAVAWALDVGDTIRGAVREAAVAFALAFGRDPEFAWLERMPRGVEDWTEVNVGGSAIVELMAAPEVVPPGFVLVL